MAKATDFDPVPLLAAELSLPAAGVRAVVGLLGEGATVPFIARYRKEATGCLDEVQIRAVQERHAYLSELHERRGAVLASISEQGKLTAELEKKIRACATKAELEDLYLPWKPKRRTRATIAREHGLEPLALRILAQPSEGDPTAEAVAFITEGVADREAALAGARDIVAETLADNAEIRAMVRQAFKTSGVVASSVLPDKKDERSKFEQYYDFREAVATIPSHRFLAIRRGERDGFLKLAIEVDTEPLTGQMLRLAKQAPRSPWGKELELAARDALLRLIVPSVETDVRVDLKLASDRAAVVVFADNVKNILLAAPLGGEPVVGIDPGQRTGCKCAAIDGTGKFLEHFTFYLVRGERAATEAAVELALFVKKHRPKAMAVGNGTGGRETEAFVRKVLATAGLGEVIVVPVSEAGASVYSASELSREELPDLDVTIRGAISIARRLQDPLAELVKIDPKSIGVGQYQHDVYQPLLAQKLDEVVESCVNSVGVDLNTASAPLLARVAGIGPTVAKKVVKHREEKGLFASRRALLEVSGFGPRTFTQAAGFLRVRGGEQPLDASAVHPERYELVEKIAADMQASVASLVGNAALAARIELERYVGGDVGLPTLQDIVAELKKPGRDPRQSFEPPKFRDDVHTLEDLKVGMVLEGVVTNVAAFGAFVDVGVHQDGLVHISRLSNRFVKDPNEVVKAGDRLRVKVLEVDLERRRISLSARDDEPAAKEAAPARPQRERGGGDRRPPPPQAKFTNNPFADRFRR